jgi:glutamate formiminotransferase / 5-formyltetrahydrofolate cyclo-ligase
VARPDGSSLGVVTVGKFGLAVGALLEFLLGLAERARQLRQLGATEQQERDHQDDQKLGATEGCCEGHGFECTHRGPQRTAEQAHRMIECVVNVSEGRDDALLARLSAACGSDVLDVHRDVHHNRAVFTLLGEQAPRRLAAAAVAGIDLARHEGVHPRLGAVDVVPFVALDEPASGARRARDEFAVWAGDELALPCFLYDDERPLPEVRRRAFADLDPDTGPLTAHPTAGACAVGVRGVLVAWNLWLPGDQIATARHIARTIRRADVRALGLQVGDRVQVSMNLVNPTRTGPAEVWDEVAELCERAGTRVEGAELVGLLPAVVLDAVPERRWAQLDLTPERTIEHRIARSGGGPHARA